MQPAPYKALQTNKRTIQSAAPAIVLQAYRLKIKYDVLKLNYFDRHVSATCASFLGTYKNK
jgi:hypothetical protein